MNFKFLTERQSILSCKQSAFTMIEIAISLAVIGFAVVAIIGVLPYGLEVQGKNREETLVNQDGPYLLEAIRNGAGGLDNLTNFVDSITVSNKFGVTIYTNSPDASYPPFDGRMNSGAWIVGLLTTPKYLNGVTNSVTAHVRSLSGALVEQSGPAKGLAFSYLLTSEVMPIPSTTPVDPESTNYFNPSGPITPEEREARTNRWIEVTSLQNNLYDVRLKFAWPLLPNGNVGSARQVYRALVSSQITNDAVLMGLFYFTPQAYLQAKP